MRERATKAYREHGRQDYELPPMLPLTGVEAEDRAELRARHVPGYCGHPYASDIKHWPRSVASAAALLRYFQHHGMITLSLAAQRVVRVGKVQYGPPHVPVLPEEHCPEEVLWELFRKLRSDSGTTEERDQVDAVHDAWAEAWKRLATHERATRAW